MSGDSVSYIRQLEAEETAIRELLRGKLSDITRPQIEELLTMVQAEIERERRRMQASGQAA